VYVGVCGCMWVYVSVCGCMWVYVGVCGCLRGGLTHVNRRRRCNAHRRGLPLGQSPRRAARGGILAH
jgi:hypothetical protein